MSFVMEAVLSAFSQVLLSKIGSSILDEFKQQHGVGDKLKNLEVTLYTIDAALNDAARRSQGMSAPWEECLRSLKDLAYDVNDVLDEYVMEATRRRLIVQLREVRGFTSAVSPRRLLFRHNMSESVDRISSWLNAIVAANNLRPPLAELPRRAGRVDEPGTSSLQYGGPSGGFGREKEVENIMRLLTTDEHCVGASLCVVPIQGPPGLGKTYLARVIFNEESIDTHFHLKMWVHVSSAGFHVRELTKNILETIEGKEPSGLTLESLHYDLKRKVEGRRFLMVLDNVDSSLTSKGWDDLLVPFKFAARGSRIVVTTRSQYVAKVIGAEPICLATLSYEATLSLFCQHAFEDQEGFQRHLDLQPTIREIVKKCQGSPLAATTLGSFLRFETDPARWESVLGRDDDTRGVLQGEMLNSYRSFYQLLPYHIRRCFEYLAVFPRDHKFQKETLIQLWMAQDYIRTESSAQVLEDVGGCYFDYLLNLSLFRESSGSGADVPRYVVHEHFHHLAFDVSREECCIIEHDKKDSIHPRVRHSAILCNHPSPDHIIEDIITQFNKAQGRPHTLLLMRDIGSSGALRLDDLAKYLTHLRTLDLSSTGIRELKGTSIVGHLKYLRYLNLSNTTIRKLPKSVTKLYLLQTLGLRNCYSLEELPKHLGNLVNLRHLDIGLDHDFSEGDELQRVGVSNLGFMPRVIEMLTNLQTLPRFVMSRGRGGAGGLQELKKLTAIHGDLHISNLENIVSAREEVGSEILRDKRHLRRVKLQWGRGAHDSSDKPINSGVEQQALLQYLKPSCNIKELMILGYSGGSFPTWVSDPSFSNLVVVRLINCKECELPPLGRLPSLKNLYIEGMDGVEILNCQVRLCGNDKDVTGFPKLRKLQLKRMQNWTAWPETGECNFPLLHELIIKDCPHLLQLTHVFPSLVKLEVEGCPQLACLSAEAIPSLRSLRVKDVGDVIWDSLHLLTSLVSLKLITLSTVIPAVGLVGYPSLKFLEISSCPQLTELVDSWLPTQLSYLGIINCPRLCTLTIEPGALPILEDLEILGCSQLTSLPEGISVLHSLQRLEISGCSKLQGLPRNGVPLTLQIFSVSTCPSLESRCQRGGRDWHMIRHIPSVWINGVAQELHDSCPSTS